MANKRHTRILSDGDTFTHNGLTFRIRIEPDSCMGEPWKEHDGHGIVSEWTTRAKSPGERILTSDRSHYRYYDFAETMRVAKRDAWGVSKEESKGKTKGEIKARAVELDYERLRAWCADEWCWVWVAVELLDVDGETVSGYRESCGGIESDAGEYFEEMARELAGEISARVGNAENIEVKVRAGAPSVPEVQSEA